MSNSQGAGPVRNYPSENNEYVEYKATWDVQMVKDEWALIFIDLKSKEGEINFDCNWKGPKSLVLNALFIETIIYSLDGTLNLNSEQAMV